MILRPRQEAFVSSCVDALKRCGNTLGIAPTGAGKTVMGAAIMEPFIDKGQVLVLQHRDELVEQNRGTFKRFMPRCSTDVFNAERKSWSKGATFAMVQTLMREQNLATMPSGMRAIFVDECFPAGTLVDGRPIESIQLGDTVKTHLGTGKVTHAFKTVPSSFVVIKIHGGRELKCTGQHPIWTQRGFVAAECLTKSDVMVSIMSHEELHYLSKGDSSQNIQGSKARKALWSEGMQGGTVEENYSREFFQAWRRDNQIQEDKRNEGSGCEGDCINQTQSDGVETKSKDGKRERPDHPSACDSFSSGMGNGGCNTYENEQIRQALSDLLQGGCWKCSPEDSDRSGWPFSLCFEKTGTGQKERRVFEVHRVEGVEVQKQTSCGTFGGMCPDGFVYNLEVANGNTYFANGYLVHNCHHVAAESYGRILGEFRRRSPDGVLLGLTATPERGDKKSLTAFFDNIGDRISIGELIGAGNLVKPRAFTMDIGLGDQLSKVETIGNEYNMAQVEAIMDKRAVNAEIVRHWKEKASDRSTVAFCSTIAHAEHLRDAFQEQKVSAEVVHSEITDAENYSILKRFDAGKIQVLLNVAKLTEGWDCQRVGCVVLVRPCSQKSTMIQMIGRGLRPCIDARRYPNVTKSDCIVLDFGTSLLTHGDIEAGDRIFQKEREKGEAPDKKCPECGIRMHACIMVCPVCGYNFPPPDGSTEALEYFEMTEMQIIEMSPFRWENFFEGAVSIANGLVAWAGVISFGNMYYSLGGQNGPVTLITRTQSKEIALAQADDYLRQHGDRTNSRKTRSWLKLPPTDSQKQHLGATMFGMSRYRASCSLTWKFNESKIKKAILG